jgi:hypothetical protein
MSNKRLHLSLRPVDHIDVIVLSQIGQLTTKTFTRTNATPITAAVPVKPLRLS